MPTYTGVACTAGLTEGNGTTDNASAIQTCITNLSANQAAVLPAGIFYVNSVISITSNKVLRGAGHNNCTQGTWLSATFPGDTGGGAVCTTLKFGIGGGIQIGSSPTRGSELSISSGYTKGSTALTMASTTGLAVNDWISIFEDGDPAITDNSQGCTWCGENNGSNLIQQFAQITAINGSVLTISRPLYYTYQAGQNPGVKEMTWAVQRAGIEDIKLHGFSDIAKPFIYMRGLFLWAARFETYNASANSSAGHIRADWSHGHEIRDGYMHTGRSYASGDTYGWFGFFWNSDHKIENNIMRIHRHSTVLEGGGSGVVFLYNYIDDNFEDAPDYLGSARTNHAPHPMFSLWEGNHISHLEADDVFGSSSHITYFRNWLRGEETDAADRTGAATSGFYAIDVRGPNRYYAAVGNVLGQTSWTTGQTRTLSSANCSAVGASTRVAYYIGCQDAVDWGSNYNSAANSTFIAHGNYDYLTDGVAYWEGGADHALKNSMYYGTKPAFFVNCAWPFAGPDLTPVVGTLPAKDRFDGTGLCAAVSSLVGPGRRGAVGRGFRGGFQ